MTTDPDFDDFDDFEPDPEPSDPSALVKHLRGLLQRQSREIASYAPVRRELAVHRAGIDTGTKLGQLFVKSYSGDLDPAAIRSEAAELGLVKADVLDPAPASAD